MNREMTDIKIESDGLLIPPQFPRPSISPRRRGSWSLMRGDPSWVPGAESS